MAKEIKQSKRGGKRPNAGRKPKHPKTSSAPGESAKAHVFLMQALKGDEQKTQPEQKPSANTEQTQPKPKGAHLWKPGQSGNPNGRPKVVGELRDLARQHTVDALSTLLAVMTNEDAPPAARVSAAAHILDRGYGKPTQSIVSTIRDARRLTDDELYAYIVETDSGGRIAEAPENQGQLN